jgi:hypothetical protein
MLSDIVIEWPGQPHPPGQQPDLRRTSQWRRAASAASDVPDSSKVFAASFEPENGLAHFFTTIQREKNVITGSIQIRSSSRRGCRSTHSRASRTPASSRDSFVRVACIPRSEFPAL